MNSQNETLATQVRPIAWRGDWRTGHVEMLDQLKLPTEEVYHTFKDHTSVAASIKQMIIRGAPAIGIAAGYGFFLGAREAWERGQRPDANLAQVREVLSHTRPTAVNLFWALDRMASKVASLGAQASDDPEGFLEALWREASDILTEDIANNLAMGRLGAALMPDDARILTHCNTGGLATGAYGTALGVIRAVHAEGRLKMVYADETRPYLQGARLTTWECHKDGLPVTLITDSMAAFFMQKGEVDAVIVGTDRTVANGDVANKIGTYGLAVLCKHHGIPFYVAAPLSTVDLDTPDGSQIVIEERSAQEVTHIGQRQMAPDGIGVRHPAFDVTPADLVTAIITEKGVARAPYAESLTALKNS